MIEKEFIPYQESLELKEIKSDFRPILNKVEEVLDDNTDTNKNHSQHRPYEIKILINKK